MKLLNVISYALSAASVVQGAGPHTKQACATTWGPNTLRNVPSYTQTNRIFKSEEVIVHKCKTTKTTTITPKPTTITSVVQKDATRTITNKRITGTTTVTMTDTSTKTKTERITSTSTTTRTLAVLVTSVSTIPTPAGFTAVADSTDWVAKRDTEDTKEEGDIEDDSGSLIAWFESLDKSLDRRQWRPSSDVNKYAQRVVCTKWITSTATRTTSTCTRTPTRSTTLARRTSISRVTKTNTKTKTINPPKTTKTATVKKQTTITVGVAKFFTTTETETSTTTSLAATETEYAACSPKNLVDTFAGKPITNVHAYEGTTWTTVNDAPTSLKCCVKCFQTEGCLGSVAWDGNCILGAHVDLITKRRPDPWTCKAGGGYMPDGYFTQAEGPYEMTLSNGPCGRWGPLFT
ncbi:hypothetical protein CC79DRAFT_1337320 [Sarocladium strictum]